MTPVPSMDPAQARMMKFMPIMFAVFMVSYPSGLVLYIMTNTTSDISTTLSDISDTDTTSDISDISTISDTSDTSDILDTSDTSKNNMMKKDFSLPDHDDADIQTKIYQKKEFYNNRIPENRTYKDYKDIKQHRDELCDISHFKPHPYQNLLPNFINPNTPYRGLIIMHGLGSGKTYTGINIAEKFIKQCQKYRTKIHILIPGPILKDKWKKDILNSTGEQYMKYIDKSLVVSDTSMPFSFILHR